MTFKLARQHLFVNQTGSSFPSRDSRSKSLVRNTSSVNIEGATKQGRVSSGKRYSIHVILGNVLRFFTCTWISGMTDIDNHVLDIDLNIGYVAMVIVNGSGAQGNVLINSQNLMLKIE